MKFWLLFFYFVKTPALNQNQPRKVKLILSTLTFPPIFSFHSFFLPLIPLSSIKSISPPSGLGHRSPLPAPQPPPDPYPKSHAHHRLVDSSSRIHPSFCPSNPKWMGDRLFPIRSHAQGTITDSALCHLPSPSRDPPHPMNSGDLFFEIFLNNLASGIESENFNLYRDSIMSIWMLSSLCCLILLIILFIEDSCRCYSGYVPFFVFYSNLLGLFGIFKI